MSTISDRVRITVALPDGRSMEFAARQMELRVITQQIDVTTLGGPRSFVPGFTEAEFTCSVDGEVLLREAGGRRSATVEDLVSLQVELLSQRDIVL